jgi:amino acid transporter
LTAATDTSGTTGTVPTDFGYRQELHRGVGHFASFAAGFSFVSILTTVFQLFGLGYFLGGASFFWAWPVVFAGQLCVALCFSELAGRWPVSGAIFQWSSRLAGTAWGWFTGWVMIIGQILTTAVAAIAIQAVLPSIWSGFQIAAPARTPRSCPRPAPATPWCSGWCCWSSPRSSTCSASGRWPRRPAPASRWRSPPSSC